MKVIVAIMTTFILTITLSAFVMGEHIERLSDELVACQVTK